MRNWILNQSFPALYLATCDVHAECRSRTRVGCGLDRPWGTVTHWRRPTMSIKTLIAMFATVAASFEAPTIVQAAKEKPTMQTATPKLTKSGHAAVNGVNYYYAVYGTGEPLLLLHGGLGQIEMFGPNLTKLAQSRQ